MTKQSPVSMEGTAEVVREGSGQMFDGIDDRYDLLNRIISLGIDQRWRKKTVAALRLSPSHRVLDLATGTADLAMMVARTEPQVQVTGLDPSKKMLAVGERAVRVMALVREMRGGRDYDPRFGARLRGEGVWADLIAQRMAKACARLNLNRKRVKLDLTQFRRPAQPRAEGQGCLFGD